MNWNLFLLAGLVLGLVACGDSSSSSATSCTPGADEVKYTVVFQANWTAATHPTDYPAGPHFSPLIGATHGPNYMMWAPETPASNGIEAMAESGATGPLETEIKAAIAAGTANGIIQGGRVLRPGTARQELSLCPDPSNSQVSLVTMVAPSPDWFVGTHGLNLRTGGNWQSPVVVNLQPYDAGTDSGATFISADADITPHIPISKLMGAPFVDPATGMVAPMGTYTFTLIE